ncbi:MAG: hypothetical protein MN733_23725 [Nitrososphaera sp.]|nr:hypothetical protein [Nitrososphaera sp.]
MWHYQVLRTDVGYQIVEVYPTLPDGPAWTYEPIAPLGDTLDELITDLQNMLADARTYKIMVEGRELETLHIPETE